MKRLKLGMKVLALTLLLFVIFGLSSLVTGMDNPNETTDPGSASLWLLLVCALISMVISYVILRSRWTGWPLVMTIFFLLYGIMTFLSQIETLVF
jgi:hypothetical protein